MQSTVFMTSSVNGFLYHSFDLGGSIHGDFTGGGVTAMSIDYLGVCIYVTFQ